MQDTTDIRFDPSPRATRALLEEARFVPGTPELLRALPDPLFVYDEEGNFLQVNDRACASVGYSREELLAMNIADLDRGLDRAAARAARMRQLPGESRVVYGCHHRKDGSQFPVEIHSGVLRRDGNDFYFASVRDLSRRHRDKVDLSAAPGTGSRLRTDADLQVILDHMPAMIGYWNRDLYCEFANQAYVEWFNLPPERTIGMRMPELLGERLFRLNAHYVEQALRGRRQRFERRLPKADGTPGIVDAQYIPDVAADGTVRGFYVLVSDVTALHESFDRNRELALRLEAVREDERRAIALTLHEGIAQDLFAMKLALGQLERDFAGSDALREAVRSLAPAVEKCMADARHIADNLRPTALRHLRIAEALREHGRYFGGIAGLAIEVDEQEGFPLLDENAQLVLFRAAQEALTNVARHARASRATVMLATEDGFVRMEIVDDGIGIGPQARIKSGSLGLLGIQERFEALGGGLVIERLEPRGTRFVVYLPGGAG